MIQAGGGVDDKESSRLSLSSVVGSGDVNHEGNDVVDVDVMHPPGVDGDVDNQLISMSDGEVVVNRACRGPYVGFEQADCRGPSHCCVVLRSPGCKLIPKMMPHSYGPVFP